MTTSNSEIRKQALNAIKGHWVDAIIIFVIYGILISLGASFSGYSNSEGDIDNVNSSYSIITFIIGGPLAFGISRFSLNLSRGQFSEIGQIFSGFKRFADSFVAFFLVNIFTLLWTMLFIIPGIIKSLSYSMTYFIMIEDESIKPMDAIEKSMAMMDGHKMKLFTLYLMFFLMIILSAILLFIPLLWIGPYMYISYAKFYDDIKEENSFTVK